MTSPQQWFAIEITAAAKAAEAVEFCFNELETLGTEIDQLKKKDDEDVTVIGYFPQPPADSDLDRQLDFALSAYGLDRSLVRSIGHKSVDNKDWLGEWKKHWRPTRVGRFLIAPSWEKVVDDPTTLVIRIEPNMAFGTGTHETTRLCLKAIDERFEPGMSFLDVGTGTGILAIAAAKLVCDSSPDMRAYDVDEDSIKIARENAKGNDVADAIEFIDGSIDQNTHPFDFVCANLTLDVIVPVLPLLVEKARKTLVLSGILVEQEGQILAELKRVNISRFAVEREGEWIAVIVDR